MRNSQEHTYLHPLKNWTLNHVRAFLFTLGELVRAPFSNLLTFIVIGIAMALPAGLYAIMQNLQAFDKGWQNTPNISLYLKQNLSSDELNNLQMDLRGNPQIQSIKYISPQQGLAELADNTQLTAVLKTLNNNPLPGVLIITPKANETPDQLQQLLTSLQNIPLVQVGQLNMTWVKRLYDIILIGRRLTYVLGTLFGVGVILIIGNTIRLIMQSKAVEINVMKLVGANKGFIRRPLLYRGFFYGFFGGLLGWAFVSLTMHWLAKPANALAATYQSTNLLQSLNWQAGLSVVFICALLGLIGAWFAAEWQMKRPEQT